MIPWCISVHALRDFYRRLEREKERLKRLRHEERLLQVQERLKTLQLVELQPEKLRCTKLDKIRLLYEKQQLEELLFKLQQPLELQQPLSRLRRPAEKQRQEREENLIHHVARLLILLALWQKFLTLWQKLIERLLFFCKFSEFPNKRRPACTTMPWNIWPALVVLWGVCWMFYYPDSPTGVAQLQPLSTVEQTMLISSGKYFSNSSTCSVQLNFHADISNEWTEQPHLEHSFTSNETYWHASDTLEYGNPERLSSEYFAPLPAVDTQLVSSPDLRQIQNVVISDPFSFLDPYRNDSEQATFHQYLNSAENFNPGIVQFSDTPSRSTADHAAQLAISLPGISIGTFEGVGQIRPNDPQSVGIVEGDQCSGRTRATTSSAGVGSARSAERTAVPLHKSTTYMRSEEPPQNAEGKMICSRIECSNLTFTRRCDWK
jgi:hypothetical protein